MGGTGTSMIGDRTIPTRREYDMHKLRKLTTYSFLAALISSSLAHGAGSAPCEGEVIGTYGQNTIWRSGEARLYRTNVLNVDADGAPNAYRVDGKGLSYICDGLYAIENGKVITQDTDPDTWEHKCFQAWTNAQKSGNYEAVHIVGFERVGEHGEPRIQTTGDPFPGAAYISTTSVSIPDADPNTQARYVNALEIPYVVLPKGLQRAHPVPAGAVAAVYRPKSKKLVFAVYGDSGGKLDEASIRLHQEIGGSPIVPRKGVMRGKGTLEDRVVVVVFPKAVSRPRTDAKAWREDILAVGQAALDAWGGSERLKACASGATRN